MRAYQRRKRRTAQPERKITMTNIAAPCPPLDVLRDCEMVGEGVGVAEDISAGAL